MSFLNAVYQKYGAGGVNSGVLEAAPREGARKGFTLVELLITLALMTIVSGAALVVFRSSAENAAYQRQNLAHVQSLRESFYKVSRDIRMAGNGLGLLGANLVQIYIPPEVYDEETQDGGSTTTGGWFRYKGATKFGARAVFGTNSGSDMNTADTLTIFHADAEAVRPLGYLAEQFNPTDGSMRLVSAVTKDEDLADGDIVALSSGSVAMIVQVRITSASSATLPIGPRFKPRAALVDPSGHVFPAGTGVYNLKDVHLVTYHLDTANNRLMANHHDIILEDLDDPAKFTPKWIVVDGNIEDFQVSYNLLPNTAADVSELAWTPDINETTFDTVVQGVQQSVGAIMLGMVSRSAGRISSGGTAGGEPIELMGHKASDESGFSRRILVETIQVRNSL